MKKILVALLAGLLLIGAASAGGNQHKDKKPGMAFSCADAFAMGKACVDDDVVDKGNLVIKTTAGAYTIQIDDAKVDPIAVSLSIGGATSQIKGDLEFGSKHCKENVDVNINAESNALAYDYSRGSMVATSHTNTFNIADTWANDRGMGSISVAGSESAGFAMGLPDNGAKESDGDKLFDTLMGSLLE